MKTTLYVFSATGNSLTTAKILAEKINAELISVASTRNLTEIIEDSDSVGFVFPVYYGNMPYPVRKMIMKMKPTESESSIISVRFLVEATEISFAFNFSASIFAVVKEFPVAEKT